MRALALTVRRKIILVVVLLSLVILAFGAFGSVRALRRASQGDPRYLKSHFDRFKSHLEISSSGDLAAATIIATEPEVVRAVTPREQEAEPAVVEVAGKGDKPKKDDDKKDDAPKAKIVAKYDRKALDQTLKRLTTVLASSIDPEIIVILDVHGEPLEGHGLTKLTTTALKQSRLVQDIRAGVSVRTKIALFDNVPHLVSAARIARGDEVLGSVIVGGKLQTLLTKYALSSGSTQPERQHRVSHVRGTSVLASALGKDEQAAFATEASRPTHRQIERNNVTIPVLEFAGATFDFWDAPITGYDGPLGPDADLGKLFLVRSRTQQTDELSEQLIALAGYFGTAALAAILVGWMLARHITRPIDRYISATQGLAEGQGDLTQRLEVQADDELGRLATNLNRVFEQIHELAGKVQKTAFRVGDSSEQIGTSSRAMLDGAKAQAVKIENSTAAVTELSASIQQVAENAGEATKVAAKSGSAAENAIQRLGRIQRTVEEAASRIEALGESGKRIGSIVEVIRHISEQTTLLALNAAIEAAHAGEQGRGFAVVADEVSNLAKRVGRSAKDIEDLIATIRDQTTEAVRAMQVGTREVEEGTALVVATLADLKTLIGVVEDTANAVNEQAIASDEIARNMDAVRTIAREVLGASEATVREGDQLNRLANLLEQSVKGFKIDGSRIVDVDPPPSRQLASADPPHKRLQA